eukprot:scaffold29_cov364-Pavlova_lutheri.AAC.6
MLDKLPRLSCRARPNTVRSPFAPQCLRHSSPQRFQPTPTGAHFTQVTQHGNQWTVTESLMLLHL